MKQTNHHLVQNTYLPQKCHHQEKQDYQKEIQKGKGNLKTEEEEIAAQTGETVAETAEEEVMIALSDIEVKRAQVQNQTVAVEEEEIM